MHPNMRGHAGGGISTGRGFPIVISTTENLNTQSSIDTEILVVDNFMPVVLWTRYWWDAQGYDVLKTLYIKTIKVLLFWKRMARLQAVSAQST